MARYNLSIDSDIQVAYLKVTQGVADKTVEATPGVMLDLNNDGGLLGIEFLSFDALKGFTPSQISQYVSKELVTELERFISSQKLDSPVA